MKYFVYTIVTIVTVTIIAGFFIVGSPQEERSRRFDDQRIQDLQSIQWQISDYWQNKQTLPEKLSDLNDKLRGVIVPADPETGLEYSYYIDGQYTFRLCATFNRDNMTTGKQLPQKTTPQSIGPIAETENWQHSTGNTCFTRTIDPDFFKKNNI